LVLTTLELITRVKLAIGLGKSRKIGPNKLIGEKAGDRQPFCSRCSLPGPRALWVSIKPNLMGYT